MYLVERRIYAGPTLEIQTFLTDTQAQAESEDPLARRERFESKEEYDAFMLERSRRDFVRLVNENFTPAGYYATLTCDQEHECHTADEMKHQLTLYWRRLARWAKKRNKELKMIAVIGRGKGADHRWHTHILIEGIQEDAIRKKWTFGENIRVSRLRAHNYYDGVDHGADYTALANYMFDHWTPEQGGHKWKATRNLRRPEVEKRVMRASDELKRLFGTGSRGGRPMPDTPDGYMLVNEEWTQYGFQRLEYVLIPKKKGRKRRSESETPDERQGGSVLDKVCSLFDKIVKGGEKVIDKIRNKRRN